MLHLEELTKSENLYRSNVSCNHGNNILPVVLLIDCWKMANDSF